MRPHRAGAAPLLFGLGDSDGEVDTVLVIGAGDPAVSLAILPDCGCDACDSGSTDLLDLVDDHVLGVVTGDFAHVSTRHGFAQGRRGT